MEDGLVLGMVAGRACARCGGQIMLEHSDDDLRAYELVCLQCGAREPLEGRWRVRVAG